MRVRDTIHEMKLLEVHIHRKKEAGKLLASDIDISNVNTEPIYRYYRLFMKSTKASYSSVNGDGA